ncbi:hypothetical protein EDB83DRAFT_2321026 [Lactarius deliciosus]|nr:hypothetical protein EDB83DRAFT_2321026 [Lactarius deliciosus]
MVGSVSVNDSGDGDGCGRSRVAIVFTWIAQIAEGGSESAPRSGAEADPVEALGVLGTIAEQGHSVKDSEGSDRVMDECEVIDKPKLKKGGLVDRKAPGGQGCAGGQW